LKPYYSSGGIEIYHCDCRELIPSLPDIDLVLTDPPYSDVTHEGARTGSIFDELVDFSPVSAEFLRDVYSSLSPKLKSWLVAFMDWRHIASLEKEPPGGLRFVRFGIWVKPNGAPQFTGDRPATGWEGIGIFHREGGKMSWNGGGRHAVFIYNKINGSHPTEKPLPLVSELISLFSNPGDLIFDPFMGSGTTLRAAKNLGRRAIGCEINEAYCEVAARKLQQEVLFAEVGLRPRDCVSSGGFERDV